MIKLIIGPMFSGKTTEMLRLLERAYIANKKVILLRSKTDSRKFLSHSSKEIGWLEEKFVDLKKFDAEEFDFIGIDEGNFFDDLKEFCIKYSLKGKTIIISALCATSECQMFDSIIEILPYCEKIIKLNAICTQCGSDFGSYTYYTAGSKTDKVSVGGKESYTALCGICYHLKGVK